MNAECRLRIWAMRAISCCADGRKLLGSGGRLAIGVNDYYITVIEVPPKRICRPSCLTYGHCLVPGPPWFVGPYRLPDSWLVGQVQVPSARANRLAKKK